LNLAIFDLDETLIGLDSDHAWNEYIVEQNLVEAGEHQRQNDYFYEQYLLGQLNINEYLKFTCRVLALYPMAELHQHRAQFVETKIKPHVLKLGKEKVEEHRARGDELIVITSTIQFIVEPIVALFDIPNLLAPITEVDGDRYTGKSVGTPSFSAGKVTRYHEWLGDRQFDQRWFYSDSFNDLPLLREVEHPVVVDPDEKLRAIAEANQWEITSFR